MFSYFNRQLGEEKYSAPYRARLDQKTKEICEGINCTRYDTINLLTLAQMSTPIEELNIETINIVSKYMDDYEKYIRARFFRGMPPEKFVKNKKIMKEFDSVRKDVKRQIFNKTSITFEYLIPLVDESFDEYYKRVMETIENKGSKQYVNIEKSCVLGESLPEFLSSNFPCDLMLNEELINIVALVNAISKSGLGSIIIGKYSDHFKDLLNDGLFVFESFILIYGYYLMSNNDLYEALIKEKEEIYKAFARAYNGEEYKHLTSKKEDGESLDLEDFYSDYEALPSKERIVKPSSQRGIYGSFYATLGQMTRYNAAKKFSTQYADDILDFGIDSVLEDIKYDLDCYKDTEDEEIFRNAVRGIPKELRRKNNKLSNNKIKEINNMLKSI